MTIVVDALIAFEAECLTALHEILMTSVGLRGTTDRAAIESSIRQRLREEGFDV